MSRSYKKNIYRKARAFDKSCRCHGGCPYCLANRKYQDIRERTAADEEIEGYVGLRREVRVDDTD